MQNTGSNSGGNRLSNTTIGFSDTPNSGVQYQAPLAAPLPPAPPPPTQSLEVPPDKPVKPPRDLRKLIKPVGIGLLLFALLFGGLFVFITMKQHARKAAVANQQTVDADARFNPLSISLSDLAKAGQLAIDTTPTLSINGQLKVNNSLVISPTDKPNDAVAGQVYYDKGDNKLGYYNGHQFVFMADGNQVVHSFGGANGDITLGNNLTVTNGQLNVTLPTAQSVLSVQGQTGNVSFTGSSGIAVDGTTLSNTGVLNIGGLTGSVGLGSGLTVTNNTLQNSGIISAASGSPNVTVTNDGSGNITISSASGGGTVNSPGGTAGKIAKFTGVQTIADSLLSESGSTVTVGGNLSVTGGLTLGTLLSVANGGTGAASLANNGVLLGQGTSPITSVTAAGSGLCLVSTAGAPTFQACPGGGGVTSLDGLSGGLTLANSTGAGTTITINDASTSQKGIASFNSTNFTASGGAINTIQDISVSATPTFGRLNVTSSQATNPMLLVNNTNAGASGNLLDLQVNGASKFYVTPSGGLTLTGAIDGQTISSSATLTGTLTVSGPSNLNGGATVIGTLTANTITPTSALTVGATNQSFTLQGNSSSSITATNGANTTTVAFQAPTANVTYRFLTAAAGTYDICTTAGNCTGAGGGVSTTGGTTGTIPLFTGSQTIGDSVLTQSGTTVTVGGTLAVNTITPTSALVVGSAGQNLTLQGATTTVSSSAGGVTNSLVFATPSGGNKTITLPNASGTVAVSATGALSIDANGNITCPSCLTSAVTSLNGLTGALNIANATASASTVTINDASTSQKGIAQFNSTNFTASGGTVNTVQNINVTATPTFGDLTLTSSQASNPMLLVNNTNAGASGNLLDLQLNGLSKLSVSPGGNMTLAGTINGQTISSTASLTGTLGVAGLASLNGGATVTGTLTANTITPTGALTVGATNQSLLLQGNSATSITATNGANTTTFNFQAPTANVTYRLLTAAAGTYDICTSVGNCAGTGGGVTTPGGTAGKVAKFTASGVIGDSIITDNGSTVTIGGTLAVNTLTPTGALTVGATGQNLTLQGATTSVSATSAGITNTLTFATPSGSNKTITIPDASGTVAVSASGPIQVDAAGNITCPNCVTTSGGGGQSAVDSLNGLTGALTLANATGSGGTVTINDASTSQKGIAQFNSTNFTASGGTVNTIQDINTTAAPTFGRLNITSSQATNDMIAVNNTNVSAAGNLLKLQLNGANRFSVDAAGNVVATGTLTSGAINGQTISNAASLTGTLGVAGLASLNGGATVTGTLTANTITSTAAMTVGNTGQNLTLQGAATTITSTSGANTTTLALQTPTANVTYRLLTAAAGTYDICTTVGNCAGVGGGVTTPGGTAGKIAKFTASGVIADSLLSESGSTITVAGNLNLVTGNQYQINGTQISSADLSNDANLAKLNAAQTFTGTTNTFKNSSDSTSGFTIQNAAGRNLLNANTSTGVFTFGNITSTAAQGIAGALQLADGTNDNFGLTLNTTTLTGNRTISLPDAGGTVCLQNSASCGFATSSGSGNYIQNQIAADQTANFRITGTGQANTSLLTPLLDTATAVALNIGTNNATVINLNQSTTVAANKNITFAAGAGNFDQSNSTGTFATGTGLVNLNGNTTVASGKTFTANGAALFQSNANSATAFQVQNAAGRHLLAVDTSGNKTTLGNITSTAGQGIAGALQLADGTNDNFGATINTTTLTANRTIIVPDESGTLCLQSSGSCGFAAATGSANYLQNQNSVDQTANFRITGTGQANTSLLTPLLDTASAVALNIGTTNATGINLNQSTSIAANKNLSFAAGAGNFDQSNSTGTFATGSGAVGLNGNVTIAAGKTLTSNGTALFQNNANTATAFQVQNAAGRQILTVDTSGSKTTFGNITSTAAQGIAGNLVLADGTNDNFGLTLNTTTLTASRTITFPDAAGTVCLQSSAACGFALSSGSGNYIQNQSASDQSADLRITGTARANTSVLTPLLDTASAAALNIGTTNATAINLNQNTTVASGKTFTANGTALFKPNADSTTAFQIQPASISTPVFDVNTTNQRVGINTNAPTEALDVVGNLQVKDAATATKAYRLRTSGGALDLEAGGANLVLSVWSAADYTGTQYSQFTFHNDGSSIDAGRGIIVGGNLVTHGTGLFKNSSDGAGAVQVQNASGLSILSTDTSTGKTTLGNITSTAAQGVAGALVLADGTNDNFGMTLNTTTLTANRTISLPDAAGTICLQNATACGFAAASGSANYIQNQSSADQTADFRISGTARANTSVVTPLLDTASGVALNIGTTNATAINLNKATAVTGNLSQSGGTITLTGNNTSSVSTTTGTLTLQGAGGVTINSTNVSGASGAISLQSGNSSAGTAGNVTIDTGTTSTGTPTVNVGATNAKAVAVGNTGGTVAIQGNGTSTAVSIQSAASGTIAIGTANAANTIQLGNIANAIAQTIGIGNNATASSTTTLAMGNLLGTSTTTIQGGTGASAVGIQAGTNGTISIGTANANAVVIGNTGATGTNSITVGQSTASNTINIGNATTATGNTQTINLGTAATGTGKATITVGNTNGGSALNLQAGTGNTNVLTNTSVTSSPMFLLQNAGAGDAGLEVKTANAGSSYYVGVDASNGNAFNINSYTAATQNGTAYVFGQQTPNASTDSNAGVIETSDFTTSTAGSISAITMDFSNVATVGDTVSVGLYTDSAGSPGTLLASSGTQTINITSAGGHNLNTVSIPTTALSATTKYWLAFNTSGLDPYWQGANNSGHSIKYLTHANTSWPASFGTPGGTDSNTVLTVYGTVTPSGSLTDTYTNSLFNLTQGGVATFRNASNSTGGFQVQNASSVNQLAIDTTNSRVILGTSDGDTTGTLLVLGTKTTSGDPTEVDGAMYYNNATESFRCGVNGAWYSCLGGMRYSQTSQGNQSGNLPPASDTVANTVTATTFNDKYSVPAGDCTPGRVYRITAGGVITFPSTSGSPANDISVKILWGATTIGVTDSGASYPTTSANTNVPWYLKATITCYSTFSGGTTSAEVQGEFSLSSNATGPAQLSMIGNSSIGQTITVNSAQNLALQWKWGTATSTRSITLRTFVVEALGP